MAKALYNLSYTLPCLGAPGSKKNQSSSALSLYNQHIISLPLWLNPCPVYLLPFLPQTGLVALGWGSVQPMGFGRSVPVQLPGNKTSSWTQSYTCLPSSHPCTQQSNICTTIHNPETKPSRSTVKTSSCLALDPFEVYTQPRSGSLGSCLPFSPLSQGCFSLPTFLALTHGPAFSASEKGLATNV